MTIPDRAPDRFDRLIEAIDTRSKEWEGDVPLSLTFYGCEIAGEAGELANVCKKLEREALGLAGSRSSHSDLRDEAADVLIGTLRLLRHMGIDPWEAIVGKFNATSDKVGMKTRFNTGDISARKQTARGPQPSSKGP